MLGPIFNREVLTIPRSQRFFLSRAGYGVILLVLIWTGWQIMIGWRAVNEVGILARFEQILFRALVLTQLLMMLFFAPIAAATSIAHEKDRRTFVLMLMTDMTDWEIILGKLGASFLLISVLLAAGLPVFALSLLLGGISPAQLFQIELVTLATGIVGGSVGLIVANWRDRTFQSLALTVLAVVLGLAGIEAIGAVLPPAADGLPFSSSLNPFRVVPLILESSGDSPMLPVTFRFFVAALFVAIVLNLASIVMLRRWNPGRNEPREQREAPGAEDLIEINESAIDAIEFNEQVSKRLAAGAGLAAEQPDASTGLAVPRRTHRRLSGKARDYRHPWNNPILWRELATRAYGNKPLIIKGAYLLAVAVIVAYIFNGPAAQTDPWRVTRAMVPLGILSLLLINAQGVTALTSERDTGALDLLLVTELTPRQFIYGKLYGILYNTKEMIVAPIVLTWALAAVGRIGTESAAFVTIDYLVFVHFAAMLGIHAAITYTNSRTAVANSLGTMFFLMIGILFCAYLIILSNREFGRQLLSFLIFLGAGSVALFGSLGSRNPSRALAIVSILTPFWTFYCIISLINGDAAAAFLVSVGIYGFALLAMLVPAVSDFDIALGRTSAIQG
jgi:ABC-type transport system involved in multi-copper enzyme maturation permease subunit